MKLFQKRTNAITDQIRCDEPSYLIWKWHPAGSQEGSNNRENAIRWGSSLRVKDGEVAVFVYHQANGVFEDFIEGPFDEIIKTSNFPVLASIVGLAYKGDTPFQAEVYYINLSKINQVRFAVPFFDVFDPRFTDFSVPVSVRGTLTFHITDYRTFIKLHRLVSFNLDDFSKQIKDATSRFVKSVVTNIPAKNNIPVIQIENKTEEINRAIEAGLAERLSNDFGVMLSGIDVSGIELDKASKGYVSLMAITKNVTEATIEAQTAANIKNIHDKQRIESENYQESLRIQREESQYAQHKQTQSTNMSAYQIEMQTQVGIAGAEALGHMGENGAGSVDLGSGGFNPAAMVAGMALGGAVGQNLAGTINGVLSGASTPPPIPTVQYYVAVDGQPTGAYTLQTLSQMVGAGTLTKDSLVWKQGMAQWSAAGEVSELQSIWSNQMPPIPKI